MKKIAIILLIIIPIVSFSQSIDFNNVQLKGEVNRRISRNLNEGSQITLILLEAPEEVDGYFDSPISSPQAHIKYGDEVEAININLLDRITFIPQDIKEFWYIKALENEVYSNLLNNGYQYKERKEIEEETIDYLNYLDNNNLLINDTYLESYIYSLIHRLYPHRLDDGRPGILNVNIVKNLEPNASIFPNGTLLISTGLLSTINSEEELTAVLAHEIAHFVLDHTIININKAAQRQRRVEFWTALMTGIAAAADFYATTQYEYHVPGDLTYGTAVLSYTIATEIAERLGMQYSREQEMKADELAVELLSFIDLDPTALSSALSKIKEYCIQTGNYLALTGEGSHPALGDRIQAIGNPASFNDPEYDIKISSINTYNARIKFVHKHMAACTTLIERNIEANVATEKDYVLLSKVTLFMYDNEAKNLAALEYINKAKSLNVYPIIEIPKQEAIVLIRLGRMDEARNSLLKYRENLEKKKLELERVLNTSEWSYLNNYYNKEYEWTAIMLHRIKQL